MAKLSSPPAGPLAAGLESDFCRCWLEVLHVFSEFHPTPTKNPAQRPQGGDLFLFTHLLVEVSVLFIYLLPPPWAWAWGKNLFYILNSLCVVCGESLL